MYAIRSYYVQLGAALETGGLFLDGLADGLMITNTMVEPGVCISSAFAVLQAARVRMVKTEFISCPGCGRTLFDLEGTIAGIKQATGHLNHLKIGIMGCIVNGPGEMADADYGYVGAGRGKVSLYRITSYNVCYTKLLRLLFLTRLLC